jgi:prophage regulatory protein
MRIGGRPKRQRVGCSPGAIPNRVKFMSLIGGFHVEKSQFVVLPRARRHACRGCGVPQWGGEPRDWPKGPWRRSGEAALMDSFVLKSREMPTKIIRCPAVAAKTGLARSSIYRHVALGSFPAPIKLGPRASGWVDAEIDAWIEAQVRKRDSRAG